MAKSQQSTAGFAKPMFDVIFLASAITTTWSLLGMWRSARDEHFGLIVALTVGITILWLVCLFIRFRLVTTVPDRRRESE